MDGIDVLIHAGYLDLRAIEAARPAVSSLGRQLAAGIPRRNFGSPGLDRTSARVGRDRRSGPRHRPRRAPKGLRTRPNRRMKMANAPALIGLRDKHGEARWRLDDVPILGL